MSQTRYEELLENIHHLQAQLTQEVDALIAKKRKEFQYHLAQGKVIFNEEALKLHQLQRTGLYTYLKQSKLSYILTAPLIYSVFFPLIILDLFMLIYQQTCFRIYGITLVSRKDYIVIDRQHLSYLNIIEKMNCMYCGYGNGLIAYTREIFARTEQFWCPIKHAKRSMETHGYEHNFTDYGDAHAYNKELDNLREELNHLETLKHDQLEDKKHGK